MAILIIGITGPIAAGKSTVDAMLRDLGADPVIDADAVVHQLYETSAPIQEAIAALFGPAVRRADGAIDRRALGALVFGDPEGLRRLQDVVHPATRAEIQARLQDAPPGSIAVVDAVKLLDGGLAALCAERWWIDVRPDVQRRRLIAKRHLTPAEADLRLAAQPRLEEYRAQVDRVIDNSGTRAETLQQVTDAWNDFTLKEMTS